MLDFQNSVKYQRKLYGMYGEASGIDPRICWPSHQDIEETKEYEQCKYPYTMLGTMKENEAKKREFEEQRQKRQEDIAKKVVKLEQWKKELAAKVAQKEAAALQAKVIIKNNKTRL